MTFAAAMSKMLAEAKVLRREKLAKALEAQAAPAERDDHNPLLFALAWSLRMNLPGARFAVIEGEKTAGLIQATTAAMILENLEGRRHMKRSFELVPIAIAFAFFSAPASARNYDCTKAGNANKAVCKQAATAAPTAAPTPAAAPTPVAPTARHYDCTKAGNANKAACKGAVPAASTPAAMPAAPAGRSPASAPATQPAPAAAPAARSSSSRSAAPTNTNPAGPGGATAMCNDGSYSHSAHRSGTCSRHGGVKTFY